MPKPTLAADTSPLPKPELALMSAMKGVKARRMLMDQVRKKVWQTGTAPIESGGPDWRPLIRGGGAGAEARRNPANQRVAFRRCAESPRHLDPLHNVAGTSFMARLACFLCLSHGGELGVSWLASEFPGFSG